jgi:AcrR family transcriptional regulator
MGDEVKGPTGHTRTYDSPVRRARARETERRVLAAADAAFAELGYVGTSMAVIAERAEVDPRTVYKIFGSKVALLSRLVDVTMVGDQEAVPVMDRPWAVTALDAPTAAERTRAFAAAIRTVMERAGAVFRTAAQAAVAEPDAAALWALGQRKREEDASGFVAALEGASMLRADRTPASAAATVWLLTSPETYLQLTDGLGWSLDDYEQWLEQSLVDALLDRPSR